MSGMASGPLRPKKSFQDIMRNRKSGGSGIIPPPIRVPQCNDTEYEIQRGSASNSPSSNEAQEELQIDMPQSAPMETSPTDSPWEMVENEELYVPPMTPYVNAPGTRITDPVTPVQRGTQTQHPSAIPGLSYSYRSLRRVQECSQNFFRNIVGWSQPVPVYSGTAMYGVNDHNHSTYPHYRPSPALPPVQLPSRYPTWSVIPPLPPIRPLDDDSDWHHRPLPPPRPVQPTWRDGNDWDPYPPSIPRKPLSEIEPAGSHYDYYFRPVSSPRSLVRSVNSEQAFLPTGEGSGSDAGSECCPPAPAPSPNITLYECSPYSRVGENPFVALRAPTPPPAPFFSQQPQGPWPTIATRDIDSEIRPSQPHLQPQSQSHVRAPRIATPLPLSPDTLQDTMEEEYKLLFNPPLSGPQHGRQTDGRGAAPNANTNTDVDADVDVDKDTEQNRQALVESEIAQQGNSFRVQMRARRGDASRR